MTERDLTDKEISKIKAYLKDERRLNLAVAAALTNKRKTPLARQFAAGNIAVMRAAIVDKAKSLRLDQQIKDAVCTGYDWCNKRGQRGYNVVINIVRLVAQALGGFSCLTLATIIFMVKHYVFDKLCNCPPPAKVF